MQIRARELVASNLRRLLENRGLKGYQAAGIIGVNQGVLSRWLSGETGPSYHYLDRICRCLETPLAELFRLADAPASTGNNRGTHGP